jgi:hypothetical protein
MGGATYGVFDNSPIETALTLGISPFTTFVVVTRAREAGRRDADRPARAAWVVQRLLAARW